MAASGAIGETLSNAHKLGVGKEVSRDIGEGAATPCARGARNRLSKKFARDKALLYHILYIS